MHGNALYNPGGKAKEYARWGVNIYKGCSNGCSYCYLRKGALATEMGGNRPALKKCFKDEQDAVTVACREIERHKDAIIRDGGLMMSFSTDPCLPETISCTLDIVEFCAVRHIPVMILTKCAEWIDDAGHMVRLQQLSIDGFNRNVAIGFTLTGQDELEKEASTNAERIRAMRLLSLAGYRTFASIEPVIDCAASIEMVRAAAYYCDHFMIGMLSGKKDYPVDDVLKLLRDVSVIVRETHTTVYWKKSFRDIIGGATPLDSHFTDEDYNMFTDNV